MKITKEDIKDFKDQYVTQENIDKLHEVFQNEVLDHPERYEPFLRFLKKEQNAFVRWWRHLWAKKNPQSGD